MHPPGGAMHRCARILLVTWVAFFFGSSVAFGAEAVPRLGREALPRSEAIELTVDPRQETYSGMVRIELELPAPTDSFRFHAQGLDLKKISLVGSRGPVSVTRREGPSGLQTLRTTRPLAAGRYDLEIRFTNRFDARALA